MIFSTLNLANGPGRIAAALPARCNLFLSCMDH